MKHIPILLKTWEVQAILDGRKTHKRMMVKGEALKWLQPDVGFTPQFVADAGNLLCPYGQPGDILWVRETLTQDLECGINYVADESSWDHPDEYVYRSGSCQIPSIHMPKAACRLFLKVKSVRVERLQEISEEDAIAEGIKEFTKDGVVKKYGLDDWEWHLMPRKASDAFSALWALTYGQESWESNLWVRRIEFDRTEKPENFIQ